ncbi:hypothetical protein AM493_03430 [Flavobacterium akiainvivens]|uniref:Uncharacterized protein n=1 Tax=Flavobacterium akiainvivens TaxID=1202724 RepID=A0A0M9VH51_9FLAO|nr:hypothetical protein [Flavobacterium akiainvivens]KOS05190.1 hypothetical protein AM493_03430 [Flavobacterium akiainvivens]SFQ50743.1 hypothetical protein SAMN05444144_106118 [Flavobacterium akiainvivens]
MKTTFYIAVPVLAFSLHAYAQQENQKADQQPPVVTEQQVAKDAQMAVAERKKDEKERYEPVKQKTEGQKDKGTNTGSVDTQTAKKSSTKPEEQ